jgi:hypothetical protein
MDGELRCWIMGKRTTVRKMRPSWRNLGGFYHIKGDRYMTRTVEIYFEDLTSEAKDKVLEEFETTEDQENWDTVPLAVIEREVEDPYP